MAKQNKTTLKGYFETGDIPSQAQYADLIDSKLNLSETGVQIAAGTISSSFLAVANQHNCLRKYKCKWNCTLSI